MSGRKLLYPISFLLFSCFLFLSPTANAQPDGAALFQQNCTACHSIGKGVVIGPDLKDVEKRRPQEWLLKWVKSSTAVLKSGDAYANDLFNKFNKVSMPDQNLNDEEIKAVLAYITKKGAEAPAPAMAANGAAAGGSGEGNSDDTDNTAAYLIISIAVLFSLVYILTSVKSRLAKAVRMKNGEPEPVKLPAGKHYYQWAREHKKLVAVSIIFLVLFGSVKGWYALASIGISQGYHPDQPIAFSHKLHAGEMNIACIYCHSGAEKSKTAGVPSANVCMNCHKFIKEGKLTGTKEIAKIYKALDYDVNTQTYGKNPTPIVWNRVHNLPDLAYFNHSQHVKVGGQQCETCHGDVKEMTTVKQFAPLTMGWCIDCHIRTPVKTEGNGYYANYHALHFNKYDAADTTLTVEKMGGTECARCHY